ncbi:ABC transporter ATP-binding protein [Jhaorihella thermophila]
MSLTIKAGQVMCLLGPSGCGKSTTLRMIAGIEMQDSGEIWVDGKLVCDTRYRVPPERREIGLMFQDFALFPHLSVADNVAFGLRHGSKAERRARVEQLLERVHLTRHIDDYPHQLSGESSRGSRWRVPWPPRPKIMLMDEPFSGLDNRLRDGIRDDTLSLLKEEKRRRSSGHTRARRGNAHGRRDRADACRTDRSAWRALQCLHPAGGQGGRRFLQ